MSKGFLPMKKSTDELLNILNNTSNISAYIEDQTENLTVTSPSLYLEDILSKKSLSKSQCIKKSGLDRTYCYQIFSGIKIPSRDKLLALCFGMELATDDVQQLLKNTGYPPLYPRDKRDSVILFALNRKLSIEDTNALLFEMNFALLL